MNDRNRRRRTRAGRSPLRAAGWLASAMLAAVATFGPAPGAVLGAVTVTPIDSGNPACSAFAPLGSVWSELRLEDAIKDDGPNQLQGGTYTDGTLSVTISDLTSSSSGTPGSFDWASNIGVDAVFVKAGSTKHHLYEYDPEATSGTDLGPQAGRGNGISHISFCYDAGAPTGTPPTTNDPTEDPSNDPTEDPSNDPTEDPSNEPAAFEQSVVNPTEDPTTIPPSNDLTTSVPSLPQATGAVLSGTASPTGTPHTGAVLSETSGPIPTLPPTDTAAGGLDAESGGWRVILLGLAILIAAALLTTLPTVRRR